jgi:hypothetical protein
MTQNCIHGNSAPTDVLETIHDSQAGISRHKCAVCAYVAGYLHGMNSSNFTCPVQNTLNAVLKDLPESQAGIGRHKCCVCAYHKGFEMGTRSYTTSFAIDTKNMMHNHV